MNQDQEELFGKYIAEFASEYDLQLNDDDIMKAIELFDECSERWQSNFDFSVYEIANELNLTEADEDIVEMINVVWKKMHTN